MSNDKFYSTDFRALALMAAVLPLLTINVCYLLAIGLDHLPACVPYISGCTSVSSTGRFAPESLIFKSGMLPSTVIIVLFWFRCSRFLEVRGQPRSRVITLRLLGVIAALSLTLYAVTLSMRGDEYRLLRRIGTNGFALCSFMSQAMFVFAYRHVRLSATAKLWRWLVALCIALPALGIAAEVAKWTGAPRRVANNIAAWNAFVVQCAWFAATSRLWWHHNNSPTQSDSTSRGRATSPRA